MDLLPITREKVQNGQLLVYDLSILGEAHPDPIFYKVTETRETSFIVTDQKGDLYEVTEPEDGLYDFKEWKAYKAEHCRQTIALHILPQTLQAQPGQSVKTLCGEILIYDPSIAAQVQEVIFLCEACFAAFARLRPKKGNFDPANIVWEFYHLADHRPAHGVPADHFYALHKHEWTHPSEE